jgi:hypothetical protein
VPTITVHRLKNTPGGGKYGIERIKVKSLDEASAASAAWWQSNGTVSVIVLNGKEIDARYEREWIDRERVPDGWHTRTVDELEQLQRVAANSVVPPTEKSGGVLPLPAPSLYQEAPEPKPALSGQCGCCMQTLQDHGERDRSPSGRLADLRCLACGAPVRGATERQLQDRYLRYQAALSTVHAKKTTPWNR